jgi:hypothetical protein
MERTWPVHLGRRAPRAERCVVSGLVRLVSGLVVSGLVALVSGLAVSGLAVSGLAGSVQSLLVLSPWLSP